MPCPDPHRASDKLIADRQHHAMTALLCGVMNGIKDAPILAAKWCNHHNAIDKHIANGVSKWDDRVEHLQKCCDEILEEAYLELCE